MVRDTVYFKTFACDLADGKVKKWGIPVKGCGALSASLHSTFYRAGAACFAELENGRNQALTGWVTRPCCWLHMLPAGGLVLAPESSAGCICAQYSLQTSLALRPRAEPSK